ncbi:MAG: aspartate/glutamate racemase family protein [Thermodesulfobacteriota bacterium]|nr:aspartate/glutamate racemase family protein [Thermodesulfobacteriota bacterium]
MKIIGLLGGMSWESTVGYYRAINEGIRQQLGGLHSAQIVMYSVDFDPIEKLQYSGDWLATGRILADCSRAVEAAGADFLLICTNTMHKVADQVEEAVHIPLLHIADATGEVLVLDGVKKVGLLGTSFTMEETFYRGRLAEKFNLDVIIPDSEDRQLVHDIIYLELCLGKLRPQSRLAYTRIVESLARSGAEAVILGCTEIGMLISRNDTDIPLYDTTEIHAAKAVESALQ